VDFAVVKDDGVAAVRLRNEKTSSLNKIEEKDSKVADDIIAF